MLVNFFKQNKFFSRFRLIILIGLAVVFSVLAAVSVWRQYFADTLLGYAPENLVFYSHFNLPRFKKASGYENLIKKILADNGLAEFDLTWLKRELAIVGQIKTESDKSVAVFSLMARTDDPQRVKQFLNEQKIDFKFLDGNRFLIFNRESVGADFAKKGNDYLAAKFKKNHFSPFNILNFYLSPELANYFSADLLFNGFYRLTKNEAGEVYLFGKIKKRQLLIGLAGHKLKNYQSGPYQENDLALNFSWQKFLSNWQNNLIGQPDDQAIFVSQLEFLKNNFGLSQQEPLVDKLLANNSLLLLTKNNKQAEKFLLDYSFYWRSPFGLNDEEKLKLEEILKLAAANCYPTSKFYRLDDGTLITELRADPKQFVFKSEGEKKFIAVDDLFLGYQILNNQLIVSNRADWLNNDWPLLVDDYLKIKPQILPAGPLLDYLKSFNSLEIKNDVWALE